jgi:diacylglycerol O-acyltransferase / wax synthase
VKRLSGWDAVLLYSETPDVHMHTLKVAVIDLEDVNHKFGVDEFRKVIRGRLHKLEPFCYELVDIPLKFHHPMWRENCEVDLDYHVRPYRRRQSWRPPPARRGGRQDRQHTTGPQPSIVGDVLRW